MSDVFFVRHEPCPKCGSKDNLGVWSDGHKWCFGCSYYISPKGEEAAAKIRRYIPQSPQKVNIYLPDDASFNLPDAPRRWLSQYEVNKAQISEYGLKWSSKRGSLILPIIDDKQELVMYQERFFGRSEGPKYLSTGKLGNYIPVFGSAGPKMQELVVVVEDYVSAMRVAEVCPCVPLMGSHLDKNTAVRLSHCFKRLGIWLDDDKKKESTKFNLEYQAIYDGVASIFTPRDPKEHTKEEIYDHVWGHFDYEVEGYA